MLSNWSSFYEPKENYVGTKHMDNHSSSIPILLISTCPKIIILPKTDIKCLRSLFQCPFQYWLNQNL